MPTETRVAKVRHGHEIALANKLGASIRKQRHVSIVRGKRLETIRPQIPGYVVVEVDINDPVDWHRVANTDGFVYFLHGKVRQDEKERLNMGVDEEGVELPLTPPEALKYQPDQPLMIVNGPYTGHRVTCIKHNNEKILVLGYLLGGYRRLHIRASCCVSADTGDGRSSAADPVPLYQKPPRRRLRGGKASRFRGKSNA